jgi:hypothetical protein
MRDATGSGGGKAERPESPHGRYNAPLFYAIGDPLHGVADRSCWGGEVATMTEAQWLRATDPTPMLDPLWDTASERKLWLLTAACFSQVWELLDGRVRQAEEVTDRYADGRATDDEMRQYNSPISARTSAEHAIGYCWDFGGRRLRARRAKGQAVILRDIFGIPFRPVTANPTWLTSTVVTLARGIYDDRAFDRLPILADALMDAGCDDADVLGHCRGGGVHVRGCWVVDLLLGKT